MWLCVWQCSGVADVVNNDTGSYGTALQVGLPSTISRPRRKHREMSSKVLTAPVSRLFLYGVLEPKDEVEEVLYIKKRCLARL